MVKEIRGGLVVGLQSRVFDSRQEIAVSVANIMHCWAWVERELANLMMVMQSGRMSVAMATYNVLGSLEVRLSAIREVARLTLSEELQEKLIHVTQRVRKTAKRRNAVAHSLWGVSDDHVDGLIRSPHLSEVIAGKSRREHWTIADFEAVEQAIAVVLIDLTSFVGQAMRHVQKERPEHPLQSGAPQRGRARKLGQSKTNPKERPQPPSSDQEE